jgi:hypothetical protein
MSHASSHEVMISDEKCKTLDMGGLCQLCDLRILYGTAGIELGKRRWGKRRQICQSNHSVVNRMLVLTAIDQITVEAPSAVEHASAAQ